MTRKGRINLLQSQQKTKVNRMTMSLLSLKTKNIASFLTNKRIGTRLEIKIEQPEKMDIWLSPTRPFLSFLCLIKFLANER